VAPSRDACQDASLPGAAARCAYAFPAMSCTPPTWGHAPLQPQQREVLKLLPTETYTMA
jgi:hypothetical protein